MVAIFMPITVEYYLLQLYSKNFNAKSKLLKYIEQQSVVQGIYDMMRDLVNTKSSLIK